MIGSITGRIQSVEQDGAMAMALIDVGGIGYEVHVASRAADRLHVGAACTLQIYTHLRADGRSDGALELFGFASAWEKKAFLLLTSVSGVGLRTAQGILSAMDAKTILQAIVRQDRATLTAAPGVGKKTAERILLELAEKASKLLMERPKDEAFAATQAVGMAPAPSALPEAKVAAATAPAVGPDAFAAEEPDFWLEAQQALTSLGFKEGDAIQALRDVYRESQGKDINVQAFVRGALGKLRTL